MSSQPRSRMSGARYVTLASVLCLAASAAALILLRYRTDFQPLLLLALILALPAAINLLLLLPKPSARRAAPPSAQELTDEAPSRRTRMARRLRTLCRGAAKRCHDAIVSHEAAILATLLSLVTVALSVTFFITSRGASTSRTLDYFIVVVLIALFVLFIVFGKWCKHRTPAPEAAEQDEKMRYDVALLRNMQSAFALARLAVLIVAVAVTVKLLGFYDFSSWLPVILSVLFAYKAVFVLISLFVVSVRHELTTAPEISAPAPGVEGGDLGIITYLEKNTGISMRSLWSIQMIKRALPYAALLCVVLLWAVTGVVMIESGEEGAHYRLGRLQEKTLEPGLHVTLPWPFDSVEVYNTENVSKMTVGYVSETDADNIWTEAHGGEEYRLLLGGGNELVSVNLRVMYRIADLRAYLTNCAAPDRLMSAAAYDIITARTITSDLDAMLSTDRVAFADSFRAELTTYMEAYHTGLEVVSVVLESIHPPVEIADIYQAMISAEIEAERLLLNAEAYAGERLAWAGIDYDSEVSRARIEQLQKIANAEGVLADFNASVAADTAYYCPKDGCYERLLPEEGDERVTCDACQTEYALASLENNSEQYRYYKYMLAIIEAYSGAKLIIVGDGVNQENIYIGSFGSVVYE